jgi:DivIVA domain-containing protein
MATALVYLVVLLVVAALFFVIASAVFGRGEELAPIPPGSSPTWLPDDEVGPGDVRALRFQQAVRGYRMGEVDWVLDRLAGELERVTADREDLRRRLADLEVPETREPDQADTPADEPAESPPERPTEEPNRA